MPSSTDFNRTGRVTVALTIFSVVLTTICVVLRFAARRIKHAQLGLDDWFAFMAEVTFWAFCADILVGVYTLGAGQVYPDPAEARRKYVQYLQSQYALVPPYILSVTLMKLSILCLYRRIFAVPTFCKKINFAMAICLLWFVASLTASLLNCCPIQYFWDKTVVGSCINFPVFFLATQLADSIIDLAVIGLPIPTILRLQLSMRKRLALVALFLLSAL
ncbi:hypothetical protein P170DRAFT_358216 [Aspergillus steynii IBT 23096]|uniref:Rhodopsin domain-containing protein n=1 Tax=Aspergillus steynii IBT 23096 TaxID=1392250 RepID=A0A2I2G730_9EURO|nr:uncharacterized protein P170DRAFT_358216 [Aspergillus steynii IBT 23096]PLB48689.1 hypothetical protein P170DRAFT_358216 [Aspergillus steynii IBT 23096]